jgi:hypothetical protein
MVDEEWLAAGTTGGSVFLWTQLDKDRVVAEYDQSDRSKIGFHLINM